MIQSFVASWEKNKYQVRAAFEEKHPESYEEIVRAVVDALADVSEWDSHIPDPERIRCIDDGHYQGTLVFVIGAKGYQPGNYWYVKVGYGSCSGCDTLQAIQRHCKNPPTESQVNGYMTLALHILQGLKAMEEEAA